MPTMNATTKLSEKVWSSPDGQKTIYKITLDVDGQQVSAKTYSDAISQIGWSGTVETYEKEGRMGAETFVKQPPKEGSWSGGSGAGGGGGGGNYLSKTATGAKKDFDNFAMYMSYAKDLVVALQSTEGFDKDKFVELLAATVEGGKLLYGKRPGGESADDAVDLNLSDSGQPLDKVTEPTKEELDGLFGGL